MEAGVTIFNLITVYCNSQRLYCLPTVRYSSANRHIHSDVTELFPQFEGKQ